MLLLPFQIIDRFGNSRYIIIDMCRYIEKRGREQLAVNGSGNGVGDYIDKLEMVVTLPHMASVWAVFCTVYL